MTCPKCNHTQTCPCAACQSRTPSEKPWVWLEDGENIACGGCGYTMHSVDWMDLSLEQSKKERDATAST